MTLLTFDIFNVICPRSISLRQWKPDEFSFLNSTPNDSLFKAVAPIETLEVVSMCFTPRPCSHPAIHTLTKLQLSASVQTSAPIQLLTA